MPKYQILFRGENFTIKSGGEKRIMGFYTTRWVEAKSPEEAEIVGINLIKNDEELKQAVIKEENPPMLYAEEITEIESFEGVNAPGSGYSFYEEETI